MRLNELQRHVKQWTDYNFPDSKPHHPLLGIGEEAGELMHAHLKAEQGIRGDVAKHKAQAEDAIGDLLIYLADYCNRMGYDLEQCLTETWSRVRQRDWKKNTETGKSN